MVSATGYRRTCYGRLFRFSRLGTVADVVPLDKNNCILVAQGLRRIRAGKTRAGIKALLRLGNRSIDRVVSTDLAFAVGPRLNAAGRLDDMTLGILLLANDDYLAGEIAQQWMSLSGSQINRSQYAT